MSAIANSVMVPLDIYLKTTYRPDCDWIDGEVRERNMGEGPHSAIQKFFIIHLSAQEDAWKIDVWPEHRVQTSENHYRIPDVCATRSDAKFERILRVPPVLCIEVMSHDDRMSDMMERVEDYLGMGVAAVWIVDPRRRRAFQADSEGFQQVDELLTVPRSPIVAKLTQVFAYLDRMEARN